MISGTIMLLLVLEAVRRTVGFALVILPALFMFHALFSDHFPSIFLAAPSRFSSLIGYLTIDLDGMLGMPTAVSSSFIVIFMMYGAVLVRSGAGTFFTDLVYAATGHGGRGLYHPNVHSGIKLSRRGSGSGDPCGALLRLDSGNDPLSSG